MPRKFFRKYVPHADQVRSNRLVRAFGSWLHHPNLWHLNRHSVAGAVAIGLFSGLVPGPLQMLSALLLVVLLKRNLPVALLATFYTNPLTIVPLYLLAYAYGALLLGRGVQAPEVEPFVMDWSDFFGSVAMLVDWVVALGKPLAVGLPALGLTLALIGYFTVDLLWRLYVRAAWRARKRRRERGR